MANLGLYLLNKVVYEEVHKIRTIFSSNFNINNPLNGSLKAQFLKQLCEIP